MTIACIDFETANHSRVSMCAAGVAVFQDGELIESPCWLVKPPKGHGFFLPEWTESCHGLSWFDVQDAPEFSVIARELLEHLTKADIVVAHNAPFDLSVLKQTLGHFNLSCPDFQYLCTYRLAKRVWPELPNHQLNTLAMHIGHQFQHHHAQSDAEAAGRVLLAMMKHMNAILPCELLQKTGMEAKTFLQ
ncbi:MAG TPA: exonuclease [Verrucomicrobiales bacterium]|nr:exonuclease [Verrucomicrobiales bacterium]